jgi:hypothetical protein
MKGRFLILIIFLAVMAGLGVAQQTQEPLSKNQVMTLVKAGMETPHLVKLIHQHGVDFDLSDDYLQALSKAGAQEPVIQALRAARPKPLTQDQVMQLVVGNVPSQRAAALVNQHSINFLPDEEYFKTLRLAGADDTLITALREAGEALTAELEVTTSPNAEVYLDGELRGRANAQGELALKAKLGSHVLKVTLKGKKDFEQSVTLAAQQGTRIEAQFETAELVVTTSPDAEIYLDGELQGRANAQGELALKAKLGSHVLKVTLKGKKDFEQSITLAAQQGTRIEARFEDVGLPPSTVRENTNPNFSIEAPTILSDTRGVDFGPYLDRIVHIVRRNWLAVIPESPRLGEKEKGRVGVVFEILKDGSMPQERMVASSGSDPLDRAAVNSIHASVPFLPLPQEFTGDHLVLQFIFLYNLTPQ